jgi:hypothetical protein
MNDLLRTTAREELEDAKYLLTIRAIRLQRLVPGILLGEQMSQAIKALSQGNFAVAADYLREVAKTDPDYAHLASKLAEDVQELVTA